MATQAWLESKYLTPSYLASGGAPPMSSSSISTNKSNGWTALLSIIIGLMSFAIVFIIIGVFLYLTVRNRVDEIQEKWPDYRCKINIMPIAGWVGPPGTSTTSNFQTCMEDFVGGYISKKFAPLFAIFDRIFSTLTFLRSSVQQIRKAIFSIRTTLASLATEIFKRIKNLYYRLFTIMKRILVLISYLVLTFRNSFYVMKYGYFIMKAFWGPIGWLINKLNALEVVVDGIKSAVNAMKTPVSAVRSFFCFHPSQEIYNFRNGKPFWFINTIDKMVPGSYANPTVPVEVVGRWDFWNGDGKWYKVGGGVGNYWFMTGDHAVWDSRLCRWLPARKVTCNQLELGTTSEVCPWTESGYLEGNPGCWTVDFFGPTDLNFEKEYWTRMLTKAEEEGVTFVSTNLDWAETKWDFTSMILPNWEVKMNDGTWKTIERLKKNDILWNTNPLLGKATGNASFFRWLNRGLSIGTWVKDGINWENVSNWGEEIVEKEGFCYQLATTLESFIVREPILLNEWEVRDTSGWLFPSVEEWREETILRYLNKCGCV